MEDSPSHPGSGVLQTHPDHDELPIYPVDDSLPVNKGKRVHWDAASSTSNPDSPRTLLSLPRDILLLILKEVTHTNDLTALALTNSTLYNLAIPHIYARFDIVWPDAHVTSSDSKSVDALTYGLATLCHGSSFAKRMQKTIRSRAAGDSIIKVDTVHYGQYTRKFSLGNGPNDWVAEYMITKESGKMLGTLVAIAISKMINLETFVWDMPTGVLSDVFMALSSLEDHPGHDCKLERVWVRWHDNSDHLITTTSTGSGSLNNQQQAVVPVGSSLTPIGILLPANTSHPPPRPPIPYSESQVEYPTFSVLPPLKALCVLDIDELAYLDEMSTLIERSKSKLQELRVGISTKATHKDFVQTWDGPGLQQVDHDARWPGESSIGERRLGGVLGILVGRVYDIRRKTITKAKEKSQLTALPQMPPEPQINGDSAPGSSQNEQAQPQTNGAQVQESADVDVGHNTTTEAADASTAQQGEPDPTDKAAELPNPQPRKRLEGKLKLSTLELERVPLSMQVCGKAFDWTVLTSLTILECAQHESLWKLLKRQFQPTQINAHGYGQSSSVTKQGGTLQYHLNLKRLHADHTSPSLITFLKETLAPNTLEVLFLQDRRRAHPPVVKIDQIFRGPIKRHRASLRKLLIDSSDKPLRPNSTASENMRWRHWILDADILYFITSGRMPMLRELSASLDYKDWHTFLQRLPQIPHLRSLHIPFIADHIVGNFEPKELAHQIVDIITLRCEIQLCYVGISTKCFEILEVRQSDTNRNGLGHPNGDSHSGSDADGDGEDEDVDDEEDGEDMTDDDEEDDDDDDDDVLSDDDDDAAPGSPTEGDESGSESGDDSDVDSLVNGDGLAGGKTKLKLREILFYDDKVAIFKARHGRL